MSASLHIACPTAIESTVYPRNVWAVPSLRQMAETTLPSGIQ